jgi:hypothetical protein
MKHSLIRRAKDGFGSARGDSSRSSAHSITYGGCSLSIELLSGRPKFPDNANTSKERSMKRLLAGIVVLFAILICISCASVPPAALVEATVTGQTSWSYQVANTKKVTYYFEKNSLVMKKAESSSDIPWGNLGTDQNGKPLLNTEPVPKPPERIERARET